MSKTAQPMIIEAYSSGEEPNYEPLANFLLQRMLEFFKDPKNEEEYQKWLAEEEKEE